MRAELRMDADGRCHVCVVFVCVLSLLLVLVVAANWAHVCMLGLCICVVLC